MVPSAQNTGAPDEAPGQAHEPGALVAVLLPLPLAGAYDYRVPGGLTLADGDFVRVPLANRQMAGVVWGPGSGGVAAAKVKEVAARLDCPAMSDAMRRFVDWVAAYTLQARGAVLKMAMSVPDALVPPKPVTAYGAAARLPDGLRPTKARARVLEIAARGPPMTAADLAREAAVGPSVIKGLAAAGALQTLSLAAVGRFPAPGWRRPGPALTPEQSAAADHLSARVRDGAYATTLLDGVPGSGKTEVYFQAIAETLAQGRQVLVLLPEIALTAQWLSRFRARFGANPQLWHSELTPAARRGVWRGVATARVAVVAGARSALFLPFPDLGLIVVDEEHDQSFKQEDGVIYNARDMAVVRGNISGFPVVLASATPSLETVVNAGNGRYGHLLLADRHAGARMPDMRAIDMRAAGPARGHWIAPGLAAAIAETLGQGHQVMLYLNRRGYAPLTLCRTCGHRLQCPNCTTWLVEHRRRGRLQCHHCGHAQALPNCCPGCQAEDSLVACGPGVERLADEVAQAFPAARLAIAASDTLAAPSAAADLVQRIEEHAVDIIIGTQIIAKGYHFPLLTLVGVIDADLGLSGGDLRATERTYQLLYQVAGRAGRGAQPGRVLVQTYLPDHPVMAALISGQRQRFIAEELAAREKAAMPPFGRLVALIVSGPDEAAVDRVARGLGRRAPAGGGVRVLGPAPAPLAKLRGRYRRRLLLMAGRETPVQGLVRHWLAADRPPGNVRVQVDVDPMSFL